MLDKGEYAEGFDYVYVKLWDSGVNPANVALYCDMLIQRFGGGMIVECYSFTRCRHILRSECL